MPIIPGVEPTHLAIDIEKGSPPDLGPQVPTAPSDSVGPAISFQQLQSAAEAAGATDTKDVPKGVRFDDVDYKGKPITVFSTTGDLYTADEMMSAVDKYNKGKGKAVEGFTFLEKGSLPHIARSIFEDVNQPTQKFLASAGRGTGMIAAAPGAGLAKLGELAGMLPQGAASGVMQQGTNIGQSASDLVGDSIKTPERAVGTAAAAALPLMTGGTSIIPQILTGIGTGAVANVAAQHLFGTAAQKDIGRQITDAGKEGLALGATQGVNGIVKYALGKGVTEQARNQLAKDMVEAIKRRFGPLANDPEIVRAWLSTEAGLRDFAQISLKSLRGSSDEIAQSLRNDVAKLIGNNATLKIGNRNLSDSVNKLVAASDAVLDAVGKPKALAKARQAASEKMQEAAKDIISKIEEVTFDLSKRKGLGSLTLGQASQHNFGPVPGLDDTKVLLTGYVKRIQDIIDNASVQDALQLATKGGRFDIGVYQRAIADNFKRVPGSLQEELGQIALRGGNMTGLDSTIRKQISFGSMLGHIPGVNKIPGIDKLNIGKDIGTRYAGTIPGQLSKPVESGINATAYQTIEAIKDYMKDAKKQR